MVKDFSANVLGHTMTQKLFPTEPILINVDTRFIASYVAEPAALTHCYDTSLTIAGAAIYIALSLPDR